MTTDPLTRAIEALEEYDQLNKMMLRLGGWHPEQEGVSCYTAVAEMRHVDDRLKHALSVADGLCIALRQLQKDGFFVRYEEVPGDLGLALGYMIDAPWNRVPEDELKSNGAKYSLTLFKVAQLIASRMGGEDE